MAADHRGKWQSRGLGRGPAWCSGSGRRRQSHKWCCEAVAGLLLVACAGSSLLSQLAFFTAVPVKTTSPLDKLPVRHIQNLLQERGLHDEGSKQQLVERLAAELRHVEVLEVLEKYEDERMQQGVRPDASADALFAECRRRGLEHSPSAGMHELAALLSEHSHEHIPQRRWEMRTKPGRKAWSRVHCTSTLRVGVPLHGVVKSIIPDVGAFVDIGVETNGLVRLPFLSYRPVASADEVVGVGDKVSVWVYRVGPDGRISLSMRKVRRQGARPIRDPLKLLDLRDERLQSLPANVIHRDQANDRVLVALMLPQSGHDSAAEVVGVLPLSSCPRTKARSRLWVKVVDWDAVNGTLTLERVAPKK